MDRCNDLSVKIGKSILPRPRFVSPFVGLVIASLVLAGCASGPAPSVVTQAGAAMEIAQTCVAESVWISPVTGRSLSRRELVAQFAPKSVVLLGEYHDNVMHHAWQVDMLSAFAAQRDHIMIGMEMLPRSSQPALDAWVKGAIDEAEFLTQSRWQEYWKFDPALYWPILRFARLNKIPIVALNVDRALLDAVKKQGWENIPAAQRDGITDPARPSEDYLQMLAQSFSLHGSHPNGQDPVPAADTTRVVQDPNFKRFVQSQQLWDRGMAQAMATALQAHPDTLMIGVMGSGHLMDRHGVPLQLADLGVKDVAVLLPWDESFDCDMLTPQFADAVYGVKSLAEPEAAGLNQRPRLGIQIAGNEQGVVIMDVGAASVAAAAGLKKDDVIIRLAGKTVRQPDEVVALVQKALPGSWLPVVVLRGSEEQELIAKLPP